VAKKLGVTNAELNKVEVAVGDARMTLGELKAKLPAVAKLEADRVEFAERTGAWELERIDQERRLLAVAEAIPPGVLPPAFTRALQERQRESLRREAHLLGRARPQWADPKYAEAQRTAIAETMRAYGFSDAELSAVADHRYVLAMQDFAKLKAEVAAARASAKRREASTVAGSGGQAQGSASGSSADARKGITRQAHAAEVARLLGRRS
jgi:hypothetical protein